MLDRAYPVLALNADFSALSVMTWRDAVAIVLRDAAYVVDEYDAVVRSPSTTMRVPAVVALRRYADSAREAAFTRHAVFLAYAEDRPDTGRTGWTCALCGRFETDQSSLTFDHVVPRSRKGTTCWGNIALAHASCNGAKGARTLAEAGLTLRVPLRTPSERDLVLARIRTGYREPPAAWRSFIEHAYWHVPLEP